MEKIATLGSLDEKIVETKTCKHCGVSFEITDKDMEFYEKVSPVFSNFNPGVEVAGKQKNKIPHPFTKSLSGL